MPSSDLIGKKVGPYEVTGILGAGGMGDVYRARHETKGNEVALKILPREYALDAKHLARFKREIEQSARLEHPNICRVYDWGEHEGLHYYCMEIVEGESLEDYIKRNQKPNLDECFRIIKGLCKALVYIHDMSIIHRDIKPTNIFVKKDLQVVLADFGLLKDTTAEDITGDNTRLGTPTYMSPEQFKGAKLDGKTDIYQLGIVFYKLLTGATPFEGDSFFSLGIKVMTKKVTPPKKFNPDIPDEIQDIILKACEKKPEDRFQNAQELANALNRYFVKRELGPALDRARAAEGAAAAPAPPKAERRDEPERHDKVDKLGKSLAGLKKATPPPSPPSPPPSSPQPAPAGFDPYGLGSLQPSGPHAPPLAGDGGVVTGTDKRLRVSSIVVKPVTGFREKRPEKGTQVARTDRLGIYALVPVVGLLTYPMVRASLDLQTAAGVAVGASVAVLVVFRGLLWNLLRAEHVAKVVALAWVGAVIGLNLTGQEGREVLYGLSAAQVVPLVGVVSVAAAVTYLLSECELLGGGTRWSLAALGLYSLAWLPAWAGGDWSFKAVALDQYRDLQDGVLGGMLTPLHGTFFVMCWVFLPLAGLACIVECITFMLRKEPEEAAPRFLSFLVVAVGLFFILHLGNAVVAEFLRHNPMR